MAGVDVQRFFARGPQKGQRSTGLSFLLGAFLDWSPRRQLRKPSTRRRSVWMTVTETVFESLSVPMVFQGCAGFCLCVCFFWMSYLFHVPHVSCKKRAWKSQTLLLELRHASWALALGQSICTAFGAGQPSGEFPEVEDWLVSWSFAEPLANPSV